MVAIDNLLHPAQQIIQDSIFGRFKSDFYLQKAKDSQFCGLNTSDKTPFDLTSCSIANTTATSISSSPFSAFDIFTERAAPKTVLSGAIQAVGVRSVDTQSDYSNMGFDDRTNEFSNLVEKFHSATDPNSTGSPQSASLHNSRQEQQNSTRREADNLNCFAAAISRDLTATEQKLKELNKLAKQSGIFNDGSAVIEEYIFDIKHSITELNSQIENLSELSDRAGQSCLVQYRAHYKNLVDTLKGRLFDVTKAFKEALEMRTKTMRQQDRRRNLYTTVASGSSGSGLSNENASSKYSKSSKFDIERGEEVNEQGQVIQFAERTNVYLQSRTDAMENVQKVIGELGQIVGKIASMVSHHEEMITRIDDDTDHSLSNMSEGEAHLLKYFHTISSNRSLILKVFGLIFLFIVFFVIFLT